MPAQPFDPDAWLKATEPERFDPEKWLAETEPQNYFADKARRLGHSVTKNIGQTVAGAGSAVQSGAELAAEALRWRAVRSGDMTEAEAAKAKQDFLDAAGQTAPMQAAQAVRDVGQELTDVGPRHFAKPDPARDSEVGAAVASGAGSIVPLLAAGVAAPVLAVPAAASMMGEQQREDAQEKGATPTQQATAFMTGAPVGAASEALLGVPALLGSVRGAKAVPDILGKAAGGLDGMVANLVGKLGPTLVPVAQQAVKSAVREGVQEGLEQIAQNTLAKDVVAYDPKRDRTEGAGMAMLAGSIVGGGVGAAAQAGQELDTRQNLAESKKTLLAQQQQLVRGQRPAQMFPVDAEGKVTNELPLPPEMSRVETDRGVFHFNPALIDEATLLKLSGAGKENGPLALGSQSKADVAARVAQGDPAVAVTERQPDGTEVKTAVATKGTAQKTAAELEASKTPGNTIATEPVEQTLKERSGNFVEDMLAKDAAASATAREAAAKEEAARTERQTELAEKKARFDQRLAVARSTLADPAAPFAAVDGALNSITSYAEDNALGLTQTQREQALQTQAALQQRHAQLAPAAQAQADTAAETRRTEAKLAEDAKLEKIRRERAALQHLETTGRDLATGQIVDLTAVPDDELETLSSQPSALNSAGLTPQQIEAEQTRRGQAAERAAATSNEAGYTLRDLILGKKPALAAAGLTAPLRLKSPAALAVEGGTMAGEHRAIGERQGGFRIFSDTGLAEDSLQERLQSLGFTAPDVTSAYALYEQALGGEDIRPERGTEQQVDFAQGAARLNEPSSEVFEALIKEDGEDGAQFYGSEFSAVECTGYSAAIRQALGKRIKILGFFAEENPASSIAEMAGGHDFALLDDRYIVDPWIRDVESISDRAVYDTKNPADAAEIQKLYGPRNAWKRVRKVEQLADQTKSSVPAEPRTRLARSLEEIGARRSANFSTATAPAAPAAAPRPILTDTQVTEQLAALRREFPALTRDLDLRSGLVADELRTAGYRGPVPAGVQAAILQLRGEKRLLVIAAQAARSNQGAGLFLHEMAHPFFDALPPETKTILRELHAQEMSTRTGPLFDGNGQLTTDVKVRAEDFPAARLRADPDLPIKEWFAERTRALNADWLAGRMPRDHSTLVRVWRELLAKLRGIFAQVRGINPDSDLFTSTFRAWLDTGATADVTHAGLAYATRQKADFASYQDTMDLGSTPLGLTLPNEIRNLAPRWQDKTLQFDSSLDKALYYAGGTPGELRTRIIDSIAQQTQLSPGQIATLARDLRQKLAPLARPTASNGTVRVPAQMQSDVRRLRGVDFAEGAAPTLPKPWPQDLRDAQIMTSVAALRAHEMYREAKAGSADHAWFVVTALINPVKLKALHDQHPDAILAPVIARERQGKNRLPRLLAETMAHAHPSWTVDEEIAQRAGMGHTDATALARLANPAQFDGAVQAGRNYILLDDVLTSGATINALRAHIEAGGGRVVAVTALAASGNPQTGAGQNLAPRPDVLQKLDAKFGREQSNAFLQEQNIAESSHALTNSQARYLLAFATLDRAGTAIATARQSPGRPARAGNLRDDTGATGRIEETDAGQAGRVDFASQANEYVTRNETPAAKVDAARADIERLLGLVHDEQLELVSYDGGNNLPRPDADAARSAPAPGADLYRAAEALKAPNQPHVVRAAYGIDPRDPDYRGSERLSSIIPALVADPKRSWDIRGVQIATARDLVTFVNVMRSPYVETAKIVLLNRSGIVVHSEIVGVGSVGAAIMDANQLTALLHRAPPSAEGYDIIFSHNHPGGNPAPSDADDHVTRALSTAINGTKHNLRDHVITNGDTYFSYAENNWAAKKGGVVNTQTPDERSPVTTQAPAARGRDADTRVEPGTAAPWEIVTRNDLHAATSYTITRELAVSLRQVDPTALHLVYLNTQNRVTALERLPRFQLDPIITKNSWRPLTTKLMEGLGREGAKAFIIVAPDSMQPAHASRLMRVMQAYAENSGFLFIDYASTQLTPGSTARGLGLFEPRPSIDFAEGKTPDLRAQIEQLTAQIGELENSQEDPADIETRGRALTAERDQLRQQLAAETREDQAAKALVDVRHPAAVALPTEPGDAWAMTPKMSNEELAAERESITNHLHDNYAGLAPAMRAHLNARLNALSAEQLARGTPLGTVTPIPKVDRQAALRSELQRGRQLRDEGDKTGNAAAQAEGVRVVKAATARLDEEFPGWDKATPKTQPDATEPPLPPEPPTAEAAPANEGDGEQSPFSGGEEETRPVRPGKWDEVYGHSSYQPTFLLKTWRKIRDVLTGIKGPIPELPSFPAARWNKTDSFIAEHGPQFYARVAEGERSLKSANDYLQRTAEEQIGRIITPLLKAEGKFNADDYARLRERQEQARRLKAEGKPTPPGVLAEIAALNSKMESSPYVLFNRLVLALDLHWRATNLKDNAGNAITLPAGINATETTAELRRLGERIAASPHAALIETAVKQHVAMVAQVAEDLKARELLAADHLANPYYFPHLTLETTRGGKVEQRELTPSRVRPGTEADFRGYLETPVGSTKAIEHDYVRAMYYHLVQVGAHNFKADAVRDYFRPYDVKATVERRAKELAKARGVPVSWEQAFAEEFAPRGYVKYGTDSRDAFPTLTVNRDLLARRLGVMLTSGDLHAQLRELNQTGVKLLPEDIRESLSQGERETWIVPARVAEALRGIADRLGKQDNAIETAAKFTLGIWKGWKLFMPWNHVRYEYGNVVADLEKLLSSSPGTFKHLPDAAKELRAFWQGGIPSAELRSALKDGVINAITAQELDGLVRLKAFEAFETHGQKIKALAIKRGSSALSRPIAETAWFMGAGLGRLAGYKPQMVASLGDFSSPELSALREGITRYAHYKANLEAIRAGARPAYGGAYWKNIEAMTESRPGANDAAERKAAAISKATFGDYGDLSVLGQTARDKFIPFYSWMEINFRYHANLFRNLRDMVQAGETTKAGAAKTAAITAAGFTARTAGGIALRLALPYLAVALWNASGDRDELEKLLSEEDRRRFHIILGRDDQGKVMVAYGQTALMDVLKWVSGPKFAQAMGQWFAGKTDFTTAAATWRDAILPDLANNTVGSFGPFAKIPYTLAARKATFPDVTDQRTVPAYDMRRNIVGQMTDEFTADQIERIVNKDYYGSKDLGAWAKQLILQARQRDPESWAFYAIKDKANDYLEKRTGTKRDSSLDAPDQQVLRNFRRAIYRGDADKAVQFYQRLLDYGYTAERFQASIRSQDPLSALPKENGLRAQFVAGLTPDDRALLDRAYVYYQRIAAGRGREAQLFPSKASGLNGQMRYQAQPRTDALRAQLERVDGMTDEEREQRAQRDQRRSLQKTR